MMMLYRIQQGALVEADGRRYALAEPEWDQLINQDDLYSWLLRATRSLTPVGPAGDEPPRGVWAPIQSQVVWCAGVTYYHSRDARMAESKEAGGGSFYDRVYDADRPELFFKANSHAVAGHGQAVRIRRDSSWNVPEPELVLVVTTRGTIVGYTIGNDVSSREIEGANPLYLPQAKVYDQSCALGPGILVSDRSLPGQTRIIMCVLRSGRPVFEGGTTLSAMKRSPQELVDWLYRETSFPYGCLLMTGTGIIPPESFSLVAGDEIRITIDAIGSLVNPVA